MSTLNKSQPNLRFSSPIPGISSPQEKAISFSPTQESIKERKSLKDFNNTKLTAKDVTKAFILYWEPYYTNGFINIPFRDIYTKLVKEMGNNISPELLYRYRGLDALLMNETDFNNFENNDVAVYLPISVGRYLILEKFEMPRTIISAQKVSQEGKFVSVFTENFPRFSLTLKAVVFGSVHIKVKQFFDIIIKHISNNKPGRLVLYDIFGNVMISQADIFLSLPYDKIPYYRLLPTSVSYSRTSSENTYLNIEVTGTVLEIHNERYV